jgi:hypothetical protein
MSPCLRQGDRSEWSSECNLSSLNFARPNEFILEVCFIVCTGKNLLTGEINFARIAISVLVSVKINLLSSKK